MVKVNEMIFGSRKPRNIWNPDISIKAVLGYYNHVVLHWLKSDPSIVHGLNSEAF